METASNVLAAAPIVVADGEHHGVRQVVRQQARQATGASAPGVFLPASCYNFLMRNQQRCCNRSWKHLMACSPAMVVPMLLRSMAPQGMQLSKRDRQSHYGIRGHADALTGDQGQSVCAGRDTPERTPLKLQHTNPILRKVCC